MKKLTLTAITASMLCSGDVFSYAGDLYQVEHGSPFATYIARKTGDLLTLIIDEAATTSDNGKRQHDRTNDNKLNLSALFFPRLDLRTGFTDTPTGNAGPSLEYKTATKFDAESKNTADHKFQTKLQVRLIEEILPGQFIVRGYRTVNLNGKDRQIMVNGVIRQRDIGSENQIYSHQLADAHVEIVGSTGGTDVREGTLQKFINFLF